jgi:hypothetical protein
LIGEKSGAVTLASPGELEEANKTISFAIGDQIPAPNSRTTGWRMALDQLNSPDRISAGFTVVVGNGVSVFVEFNSVGMGMGVLTLLGALVGNGVNVFVIEGIGGGDPVTIPSGVGAGVQAARIRQSMKMIVRRRMNFIPQ